MKRVRIALAIGSVALIFMAGWLVAGWQGVGLSTVTAFFALIAFATIRICPKCRAFHGSGNKGLMPARWCRKCGTPLAPPSWPPDAS
jgi:hypothetical protein